jgi:hypothetical protein
MHRITIVAGSLAILALSSGGCGSGKTDTGSEAGSSGPRLGSGSGSGTTTGSRPSTGSGGTAGVDLAPLLPGATSGAGTTAPTTPREPDKRSIDRTTGVLKPADVASLKGGGSPNGMAFLYPYDRTVFPGGILAPLLQWSSSSDSIDGVYVRISSQYFDYQEVFGPVSAPSLQLPQDAWTTAAQQSQGEADAATVELTTISGGVVSGPIKQTWLFARGQLKSAVYYNTYNSALVTPNNGAVMRILPLQDRPEVVKTAAGVVPVGPCYSCHSMSANGQMLVAQRHQYPGGPYSSTSFDVTKNPGVDPPALAQSSAGTEDWGFSAVFPDGSKLLTAAQPGDTGSGFSSFPFSPKNLPAMLGPREGKLIDTATGTVIPSTGLTKYAMMPAFSPDGTKVVFNDYDNGGGRSLAMMSYDDKTHTFADRVEIYRHASLYPGWPNFTPDSKKVIFALGTGSDFATVQDPPTGLILNRSNLLVVDLATKKATELALANGAGQQARDRDLNYYPTVSPVAAGGYFWVFFTSRRSYGNVMTQPELDASTKKLWVAAIDVDSEGTDHDISHPAFYLPGQELASGNMRAFATLTPCKVVGNECSSGIDCCGGFCVDGLCSDSTPTCAQEDDKCTTSKDCCGGGQLSCIGGHCSVVVR